MTFQKATSPPPPSSVFDTADEEGPPSTAYGAVPLSTPYGEVPPGTSYGAYGEVPLSSADEGLYEGEGEGDPFTSPLVRSVDTLKKSIERQKQLSEDFKQARERAKERAKERALKKLLPAPGWKPFGTPTKRRLGDKDW